MPASARIQQILEVLTKVRAAQPSSLDAVATARRRATLSIASERGVNERTVADKCWRGLDLPTIEDFDRLIWGWLGQGDPALRQRLEDRVSSRSQAVDREAIAGFFAGETVQAPAGPTRRSGQQVVDHVTDALSAEGLHFTRDQVADFYLCLRTKPFVLLAGISGTGKSLLARRFAEACGFACPTIAVRPDWSDPGDLLGYRNLQEQFVPGRLVPALVDAWSDPERPYFVLLDEMNLARVEHYLADLLSIIETRRRSVETDRIETAPLLELSTDAPIQDDPARAAKLRDLLREHRGKLGLPPNLTLVGTVNMDESTHPFSRKVLDRAMTMELNAVDLEAVQPLRDVPPRPLQVCADDLAADRLTLPEVWDDSAPHLRAGIDTLIDLNRSLSACTMQVGYRVRDELCLYLHHNHAEQLLEPTVALDLAVHHKVLPRIQGGDEVKRLLGGLSSACSSRSLERCAAKIEEMERRLDDSGYTAFWS